MNTAESNTYKTQSIAVHGRRWFQRTYGNTYFTADILIDGELVHTLPYEYGYGDYYIQAAGDWLEANGYVEREHYNHGGAEHLRLACERQGITLYYTAEDVSRKRDL